MSQERITETFDERAGRYDQVIQRIIPKYQEQNDFILTVVPFTRAQEIRCLDLGAGTGVLSEHLLRTFPKSQATLVDDSEKMLKFAAFRLSPFKGRFSVKKGDFAQCELEKDQDVVVAGLSVHHLPGRKKADLFRKVHNCLRPGGIFIMRDIVLSGSERLDRVYQDHWVHFMKQMEFDPKAVLEDHRENDSPSKLTEQLEWLREAGFEDAECPWRFFNFAIITAYR